MNPPLALAVASSAVHAQKNNTAIRYDNTDRDKKVLERLEGLRLILLTTT